MRLRCLALLLCPAAIWAQNEQDLAEGKAIFRSNCAFCHGLTGGGGRGPALISGRFLHGSTDDDIKRVILEGVPGTNMPAFERMDKQELTALVHFIRGLSGSNVSRKPVPGDAAHGQQVYAKSGCANCHAIGDSGSIYGPELTRIGAGRSTDYIRESIVNPSADVPQEFEGVTVVTRDGKRISGLRINEDTFTVQLRDMAGKIRMFRKQDVREVVHETKSLMPSYKSMPQKDLTDLLAYLDRLRGNLGAGAGVRKSEGIR